MLAPCARTCRPASPMLGGLPAPRSPGTRRGQGMSEIPCSNHPPRERTLRLGCLIAGGGGSACDRSLLPRLRRLRRYISRLDAPDDDKNAVQYRFTLPLKVVQLGVWGWRLDGGVCMYVDTLCLCACLCASLCICVYVCMCMYVDILVCVYVCRVCLCACMCVCACVCVCVCVLRYTQLCLERHTHPTSKPWMQPPLTATPKP